MDSWALLHEDGHPERVRIGYTPMSGVKTDYPVIFRNRQVQYHEDVDDFDVRRADRGAGGV